MLSNLVIPFVFCLVAFIFGFFIGVLWRGYDETVDGKMIVDHSNPEKEVITLELDKDPEALRVYTLEVQVKN